MAENTSMHASTAKRLGDRTFLQMKSVPTMNNKGKPTVAIIGGGIAGLSCAKHLSPFCDPTVFDTGRLRPGGRCSSRFPSDKPKNKRQNQDTILSRHTIDHAAQILTVPRGKDFGKFRMQVDRWVDAGVLACFPKDSVVEITDKNGNGRNRDGNTNQKGKGESKPQQATAKRTSDDVQIRSINSKYMYYATDGMGSIPLNILNSNGDNEGIKIHQDVWISPSNGVKFVGTDDHPQWSVQTNGRKFGTYDHVVIAHNGKCADRLMSRTPAKDLHSLLRVDFKPFVPNWGGKRMTLNSIYSLTVALKKVDGKSIFGNQRNKIITAFIKNEPTLRLVTNQSRKYGKEDGDVEILTILSSAKFAKKYKGPQENLPIDLQENVTKLMLGALERSLGLENESIHDGLVLDKRLQLWGAAVPLNVWSGEDDSDKIDQEAVKSIATSGFLYDAKYAVGACGDWLLDPSIGGAWESGRRLANWLVENNGNGSIGLPPNGQFKVSKAASGSGIGNVR